MPFATGFFLIAPEYRSAESYNTIASKLRELGFEIYETNNLAYMIFYVEAPDVKSLERIIKTAEGVEGVLKAFIAWGFLADAQAQRELEEMLERGEISLTEEAKDYFRGVLKSLE